MASTLDEAERQRRLRAESETMTDWGAMARGAAANQWSQMSPQMRIRFENALHTLLVEAYLQSLGGFDPAYHVAVTGTERHRKNAVWVNLELSGFRIIKPEFGFLVNDKLQVIDARMWSVQLIDHLRDTIDRYVARHGLQTLLTRIEQRASRVKSRTARQRGPSQKK